MGNDRPEERFQPNQGAGADPSARLLDDALIDLKRVNSDKNSAPNPGDYQATEKEAVLKEFELHGFKTADMKTPAGQREILIEWGETSIEAKGFSLLDPTRDEKEKVSKDAKDRLENHDLYKLLSKTDQQALIKAQEAILKGDVKALADLVKQYKGDPEKLEALGRVIEKNLNEMGVNIQIDVRDNGKLMVYGTFAQYALEVSPDGKAAVKAIQANLDGSVEVLEGRQLLRPRVDDVAKGISNGAVLDALSPKMPSSNLPPWGFPPGGPPVIPGDPYAPGDPPPVIPGDPYAPPKPGDPYLIPARKPPIPLYKSTKA